MEADAKTAERFELRLPRGGYLTLGGEQRALVMGVLNITPDSFSDGGLFASREAAVAHALQMAAEGADVIDVGGESTRPGSDPVPVEEQLARIIPAIHEIARRTNIPISVDTTSAEVARRALDVGAQIVNDVSALRADPEMGPLVARTGAPVVLMHMQGRPKDMQVAPHYECVVEEVVEFLRQRIAAAREWGIQETQVIVDPGFGFGKAFEHNMTLLRELAALRSLRRPILVGTSRKAMIGAILGVPPRERLFGTAATVAAAVERGAHMVRVHDVQAALHVVKVIAALHGKRWN